MDCMIEIVIPPWTRLFLAFRRIALETVSAVKLAQTYVSEHEDSYTV